MLTMPRDRALPMRRVLCFAFASLLLACNRSSKEQQLAECVAIYRTSYVTGQIQECLVKRYRWSPEDAREAEQKRGKAHPDSAAFGDSGRIGDSVRR